MSATVLDSADMQCKGAHLRRLLFGAEQAEKAGHVLKAQARTPTSPSTSCSNETVLRLLCCCHQ